MRLDDSLRKEADRKIKLGCEHIIQPIANVFRRKKTEDVAEWKEKIEKIVQ